MFFLVGVDGLEGKIDEFSDDKNKDFGFLRLVFFSNVIDVPQVLHGEVCREELVSLFDGVPQEHISQVNVLEEGFLDAFVVPVARISDDWVVVVLLPQMLNLLVSNILVDIDHVLSLHRFRSTLT